MLVSAGWLAGWSVHASNWAALTDVLADRVKKRNLKLS